MPSEVAVLPELVDLVPGAPLRHSDPRRFLRAIGADPDATTKKAEILRGIGYAAYQTPLPPRWSEQVDVRGYVYFACALRVDATWTHPLLASFRETLAFASDLVDDMLSAEDLEQAAASVQSHLQQVQDRAALELREWSGPHKADGCSDEFFHNDTTKESTWESPLEVWQYDLHVRYWLLVQLLQELYDRQVAAKGGLGPALPAAGPPPPSSDAGTPRFRSRTPRSSVGSNSGGPPGPGLRHSVTQSEGDSGLDDTLSTSGFSAAVRSHATSIASSLVSSIVSFKPASESGSLRQPELLPGSIRPRPPRRAPPPLRHLAAPPRTNDFMPENPMRTATPKVGGFGVVGGLIANPEDEESPRFQAQPAVAPATAKARSAPVPGSPGSPGPPGSPDAGSPNDDPSGPTFGRPEQRPVESLVVPGADGDPNLQSLQWAPSRAKRTDAEVLAAVVASHQGPNNVSPPPPPRKPKAGEVVRRISPGVRPTESPGFRASWSASQKQAIRVAASAPYGPPPVPGVPQDNESSDGEEHPTPRDLGSKQNMLPWPHKVPPSMLRGLPVTSNRQFDPEKEDLKLTDFDDFADRPPSYSPPKARPGPTDAAATAKSPNAEDANDALGQKVGGGVRAGAGDSRTDEAPAGDLDRPKKKSPCEQLRSACVIS